jgi:hypothetical protein
MKTFLILIMAAALAGGSYLSKPNEADFKKMIHDNMESQKKTDLIQLILHLGKGKADVFLQNCKFNDHLLWTDVERDGKKIYTGVFSHWFANDLKIEAPK